MSPLDQRQVYQLIERFAGQANVLTIPRLFIDWTGDHISALLLSQILYWGSRTKDDEGWFYKSAKDWQDELGISDYQLSRATKKLAAAGVETKLRKIQGAPTLHYRIDQDRFLLWISEKLGNPFPTRSENHSAETGKSLRTETTDRDHNRDPFESSNDPHSVMSYDDDRLAILPYVSDLARELNDQAPLASSVTRALNIFRTSGLDLDTFIDKMLQARTVTQVRTSSIRTTSPGLGSKPKMQYWFAVLEDVTSDQERTGTSD